MRPVLLFAHGWGFDRRFFEPVKARLSDWPALDWDFGFTGDLSLPEPPQRAALIGVGHSYGALRLLRAPGVRRVIAINGFSCFVQKEDFPDGVPARLIQRMKTQLARDPAKVRADFLARCGLQAPSPFLSTPLDEKRLSEGLDALLNWDCRAETHKVGLALAGRADPLLGEDATRRSFPGAEILWRDGGHLLPLSEPEWCAGEIRRYLERQGEI